MPFELELPEIFNAADYFVDRNVREGRGAKTAIRCGTNQFSYSDVQAGVNRFGNSLKSLGVRMEERIALLMLDTELFPQAFFGSIKMGAIPICLNTLMRPKDYEYFLNDSRARVLVIDAHLLPSIEPIRKKLKFLHHVIVVNGDAPAGDLQINTLWAGQSEQLDCAETKPDDACFWLYSSGSTGLPKGTVHLHRDMVYSCETYGKQVLGVKEGDICFSAAKLFFAYGLGNGLYFPFSVGATAVYMPDRPTPEAVFQTIKENKPTLFFGVPTLYASMLEAEGSLTGVRLCVSAGEALPADILKRWKERFSVDILDGIGSTELVHIFISNYPNEIHPGSTGRLVPGHEAKIVDEQMEEVPQGEVGTLLVKSGSAAAYYWNKREKTQQTMLGPWLNTGDKFFMDEQGLFFYAGRTDDMLKVGGIWLSPIEVEACIIAHPAVLECAVVAATDPENLVKPKAYIVLKSGHQPSDDLANDIKQHVKSTLAPYKYPRWIEFIDELPKTATGKIKRFKLRIPGDDEE
ncbi:benzoate-CoA ligase family protein [Sedimenticola selenatireducens]|uniref:Benzoate-CoA ligase family protein n=1 Tax=Sedimenticola selenatireducens TaxID=191960 RepID=A0A557S565_9GAMM|nr:benzoate-CoA ligase family protein [Sedimenticola selenatireducens]TVO72538.1 benzoate-CoA ligase family protein [Sedimenticola selenatireducens]TVT64792.1 MAG: benzoate-CoA ligase family protein [Sedimenticola selenatireducens]